MDKERTENKVLDGGLTLKEFEALSRFIYSEVGIKMPPNKKIMLEARLKKRMKELGMGSFSEYSKLILNQGPASELFHFIDVITTNKTDFFREPKQFSYLTERAMPELRKLYGAGSESGIRIWSAGCSTGEEPYTLAMVLHDELGGANQIKIFASDVSTQVLEKASLAIYEEERAEPVPVEFKRRYLLRSKSRENKLVRIVPELRRLVAFRRINFMDDEFDIRESFHAIFCRNVIIYFDRKTQEEIIGRICRSLLKGGVSFHWSFRIPF